MVRRKQCIASNYRSDNILVFASRGALVVIGERRQIVFAYKVVQCTGCNCSALKFFFDVTLDRAEQ